MFVEGQVEITIKDRMAVGNDDHQTKLWIQQSFRDMCCYRINDFARDSEKLVRATVALKTEILPDMERRVLESNPNDVGAMRSFVEKMFEGKGTCRCVGEPSLRNA